MSCAAIGRIQSLIAKLFDPVHKRAAAAELEAMAVRLPSGDLRAVAEQAAHWANHLASPGPKGMRVLHTLAEQAESLRPARLVLPHYIRAGESRLSPPGRRSTRVHQLRGGGIHGGSPGAPPAASPVT